MPFPTRGGLLYRGSEVLWRCVAAYTIGFGTGAALVYVGCLWL